VFVPSKTRLEMLARDKHSSLLRKFVNSGRQKFYMIGPLSQSYEEFYQGNKSHTFLLEKSFIALDTRVALINFCNKDERYDLIQSKLACFIIKSDFHDNLKYSSFSKRVSKSTPKLLHDFIRNNI
jgi:hypothetical protein